MVRCSSRRVSGSTRLVVGHPRRPGGLVDQVAPDPLQEPLRPHDVAGRPRAGDLHRPGGHLVQAEGVGAVALAHLVRGHDVAQRLAHLPVLLGDRCVVPRETTVRRLDHLLRRHVAAAGVGVGVRLDVALVEQPPERLLGGDLAQVVEHLVPEPGVQQVQDGVLDPADVQVDTAGVARPRGVPRHPVLLDLGRAEVLVVVRVQVAQVVPARAGPLRHRVRLAPVGPHTVAQVQLDVHPVRSAAQRRLGLGVRVVRGIGLRCVVRDVGQLDGQLVVGQRDGAVLVPHDRERLTPVALPREQPVPQLVLHDRLAGTLLRPASP